MRKDFKWRGLCREVISGSVLLEMRCEWDKDKNCQHRCLQSSDLPPPWAARSREDRVGCQGWPHSSLEKGEQAHGRGRRIRG